MIFWTGRGWLVLFLFGLGGLAPGWIANAVSDGYGNQHNWPGAVGVLLAGLVVFFGGRSLNRGAPRPSPGEGGPFQARPDHSFMFVRMEHWGPVLVAIGILFLAV